jgi:hypothetical protein
MIVSLLRITGFFFATQGDIKMAPATSPLASFLSRSDALRERLINDSTSSTLDHLPTLREELTYSVDDYSLDGLRRVYNRVYRRGLKFGVPRLILAQKLDEEYSELRDEMLEHLAYLNAKRNLDAYREAFESYALFNQEVDAVPAWNDLDFLDEIEYSDLH